MPTIQPAEIWEATGRWYTMGGELMRLKDRHNRPFALGATHEEVVTTLVKDEVTSYKKLPLHYIRYKISSEMNKDLVLAYCEAESF